MPARFAFGRHGSIPLSSPSQAVFFSARAVLAGSLSRLTTGARPLDVVRSIVAVKKWPRLRTS